MGEYAENDFWVEYENFVLESLPRHREILKHISLDYRTLLDLGCGKSCEAKRLFSPENYIGVDLSPPKNKETKEEKYITGNYRDKTVLETIEPGTVSMITSLFSVEITKPFLQNYSFYKDLFGRFINAEQIIVSGFYYKNKADQIVVEETGGLWSYQSIENPLIVKNNFFHEERYHLDAPSKLFGEDVVEVWKVFTRKEI